MDKESKDLIKRVKKATAFMKHHKIKREYFFDDVYGPIKHSENMKLVNRWQGKTPDLDFTIKLEKYAETQERNLKDSDTYKRFLEFLVWYEKMGAPAIEKDKIEQVYNRFLIN